MKTGIEADPLDFRITHIGPGEHDCYEAIAKRYQIAAYGDSPDDAMVKLRPLWADALEADGYEITDYPRLGWPFGALI